MILRPPRSTRTDTLFPSTTLFRSPDDLSAENRLTAAMVGRLDAGEDVVVVRQANRIEAAARLPGTDRAYVYASRDTNVPGFHQSARASAVLADYNSLFERSEERIVGQERLSIGSTRWALCSKKQKQK